MMNLDHSNAALFAALALAQSEVENATKGSTNPHFKSKYAVDWSPFLNKKWTDSADTALPSSEVKRLAERLTAIPNGFKPHALVQRTRAPSLPLVLKMIGAASM